MREVTFKHNWNYRLNTKQTVAYKAGETYTLTEALAKEAEADGAIPKAPAPESAKPEPKGDD